MMFITAALAQDIIVPSVPVVGVSPVVQWLMGIASVMLPGLFSVLLIFLKQKFNAERVDANEAKVFAAARRGAALGLRGGHSPQTATAIGVAYVKANVPGPIAALGVDDIHLTNAVLAAQAKPESEGP